MIRQDLDENFAGVTLLHMALTEKEMVPLREVATALDEWKPGRRESGYFKLNLRTALDPRMNEERLPAYPAAWNAVAMMRQELEHYTRKSVADHWDAYLLFYPDGSYSPWHKDPASFKKAHARLNIVIDGEGSGGIFCLRQNDSERNLRIPVGSGVVFSPSEVNHSISIVGSKRLVLSVGALYWRG